MKGDIFRSSCSLALYVVFRFLRLLNFPADLGPANAHPTCASNTLVWPPTKAATRKLSAEWFSRFHGSLVLWPISGVVHTRWSSETHGGCDRKKQQAHLPHCVGHQKHKIRDAKKAMLNCMGIRTVCELLLEQHCLGNC